MTWVEGIGDEVIEFFVGLLVVLIGTVAWWSTRITDRPAIRTVLVFERRAQNRSSPQHTNNQATSTVTTSESGSRSYARNIPEENKPPSASTSVESNSVEGGSSTAENRVLTPEEEEQNTILQNMDSNCVVRRRRLDFFNQEIPSGTNSTEGSVESVESVGNNSSTVENNMESENNTYQVEEMQATTNTVPTEENDITIKLKYINDDLKLVNGNLKEPLGDFRRRHFEPELSSNKLVKLIFNGQVLQRDDLTLQGCGLFDNCVVHCLVHQKRQSPLEQNTADGTIGPDGRSTPDSNRNRLNGIGSREQPREWDLGNLFFAVVSFVLGAAWYFRYEYAQLYTVTATIALVGLTGIFTVLLVGMYFPDPEPVQPTQS